ncbi:hypothetical protein HYW46_03455 [Candidatus Daviesbacteria bacterium]|nr:hypothetical protein [Candidatus Daviesbacteria bacterium]
MIEKDSKNTSEFVGNLPLLIDRYRDTRAGDTYVEPVSYSEQFLVSEKFTQRQIEVLAEFITSKRLEPVLIKVSTIHTYNEFREPSYWASLVISCKDEKNFHELIKKHNSKEADYDSWLKPGGWIQQDDLGR